MDPVELMSKLEKVVDVYSVSDEDACGLLMTCIPRSSTSVLLQDVCDKRADRGARREALLRLAGTDLIINRNITEVKMEIGEHPLAFRPGCGKCLAVTVVCPMHLNKISFLSLH